MAKQYTIPDGIHSFTVKVSKDNSILSQRGKAEKAVFVIAFILFSVYAISLLFPLLFLVVNSFKGGLEYINDRNASQSLALPDKWLFTNYLQAFTEMKMVNSTGKEIYLPMMLVNSIWYTVVGMFCGVVASTMTGYCVAKYRFALRGFFYGIAIFSMTIPIVGSSGAAFRLATMLKLYNSPLYPIFHGFGGFGFNFLILYGFFSNLPWSYAEAVFIDGGGHSTALFRVMLPQAWPPMLTLAIMAFIGCWNDYMTPLLYLPDYPTLASGIYRIQMSLTRGGNYPIYFAGLVVSTLPVIIVYACFSNTIMQNFTVGGLKG